MSFLVGALTAVGTGLAALGGGSALAGGAIAAGVGGAVTKGFGAMGNKAGVEAGRGAAYDIYQEQLGLLGEKKDVSQEYIESQYSTGMEELAFGSRTQARSIQESGDIAMSKSGLAGSTVIGKMETQMKDLFSQYRTTAQKQLDTRQYSKAQADFAYRSGEMSAEEAYQGTLTGLEATPTTFLEGMFS